MSASPKSFFRQFVELMTGSSLAQLLSLVLMPVISRLYAPPEMGEYGIYVALSSVFGILANLRLDLAVVLGRDDEESARLVWTGLGLSALTGLLLFCGMTVTGLFYQGLWHASGFVFLTALSTSLLGWIQIVAMWHSRHRRYPVLAKRAVGEKAVVLGFGIGFGMLHFTSIGLVASQTLGMLFSMLYLASVSQLPWPPLLWPAWRATWRHFADFPSKTLPSALLLMLSQQMPALLFGVFFLPAELGLYNLAYRVFEIPINLIGYTFSTVYYQYMSRKTGAEKLEMFWKSTLGLAALFVPGLLILGLFGQPLFAKIFGEVWRESGSLAPWFSCLTLFRLLFISQSSLLLVQRKLHIDLAISVSLFVAQACGFAVGYLTLGTLHACMAGMSLAGSLVFLGGLFFIHRSLSPEAKLQLHPG